MAARYAQAFATLDLSQRYRIVVQTHLLQYNSELSGFPLDLDRSGFVVIHAVPDAPLCWATTPH